MQVFHVNGPAPLYTNTFLVLSEAGSAAVVDPAADAAQYLKILEEKHAVLTHIFLTHGHHDHIGAVRALREKTGAKVYAHPADNARFHLHADVPYQDGADIAVDELTFHVIHTPGHTEGSTCLLCGDLLFAGDTLFAGDIGRCDLPGGDYEVMQQSLRKLCAAVTIDAQVLPGHEEFSTMDAEKASNPYLQFDKGATV